MKLHEIGSSNDFLNITQKSISNRRKNKLDFIKIKKLFASNNTFKKVLKGSPQNAGKYLPILFLTRDLYIKKYYNQNI